MGRKLCPVSWGLLQQPHCSNRPVAGGATAHPAWAASAPANGSTAQTAHLHLPQKRDKRGHPAARRHRMLCTAVARQPSPALGRTAAPQQRRQWPPVQLLMSLGTHKTGHSVHPCAKQQVFATREKVSDLEIAPGEARFLLPYCCLHGHLHACRLVCCWNLGCAAASLADRPPLCLCGRQQTLARPSPDWSLARTPPMYYEGMSAEHWQPATGWESGAPANLAETDGRTFARHQCRRLLVPANCLATWFKAWHRPVQQPSMSIGVMSAQIERYTTRA